jgi:hypothetical protein
MSIFCESFAGIEGHGRGFEVHLQSILAKAVEGGDSGRR